MKFKLLLGFLLIMILFTARTALGQDVKDPDSWQIDLGLYLWYTDIGTKSSVGGKNEVQGNDLIDTLQMGLMGLIEARKGQWSFLTDFIYLNVEDENDIAAGLNADLELTNWIVTPVITYRLTENDRFECRALAGARYIYLEADLVLTFTEPLPTSRQSRSESDGNWDNIVGVRGNVNLTENWHLPYHLNIGTGYSDYTWQALVGGGYRFSRFDIVAGYRYLEWAFDARPFIDSLDVKGPFAGIRVLF